MPESKIYIEEKRFCEESNCKYMKRLIVGFIRFIESANQEVNIPEHFFDDVPDNLGYFYEYLLGEDGEDVRGFKLHKKWQTNKDDCGGEEHPTDDVVFNSKPSNVLHLRLID